MNMTPENQTDDMSMEDILSSIKDILESDSQEQHVEAQASAEPQTTSMSEAAPTVAEAKPMAENVATEAEEEDVFDLSKSMIIDEPEKTSTPTELDETGPDFEINTKNEDPLLAPDDIELPEFDDFEKTESSSILENAQNEEDDDLALNIDEILQSASETIAEDNHPLISDDDIASAFSYDKEISNSNTAQVSEIDVDSEPIYEEPMVEEKQSVEEWSPVLSEEQEKVVESEPVSEPEVTQTQNMAMPEPEVEDIEPIIEEVSEVEENIEPTAQESIPEAEENIEPAAQESIPEAEENIEPTAQEDISEAAVEPTSTSENNPVVPEEKLADTTIAETIEPENKPVDEKVEIENKETAPESKKADAADVSADIINNFAKMFAEQSQENKEKIDIAPKTAETQEPISVSGMGNGSKTIEQVVEDVIQGIVASSVSAEMAKNVDIVAYAKKEIHAQTRAWLEANLPAIVEAAVQKEIERVMVKVGH